MIVAAAGHDPRRFSVIPAEALAECRNLINHENVGRSADYRPETGDCRLCAKVTDGCGQLRVVAEESWQLAAYSLYELAVCRNVRCTELYRTERRDRLTKRGPSDRPGIVTVTVTDTVLRCRRGSRPAQPGDPGIAAANRDDTFYRHRYVNDHVLLKTNHRSLVRRTAYGVQRCALVTNHDSRSPIISSLLPARMGRLKSKLLICIHLRRNHVYEPTWYM